MNNSSWFYQNILRPRSKEDERQRRELILNIFLVASIILSFFATITLLIGRRGSYDSGTPLITGMVMAVFLILYLASRGGASLFAAHMLIGIYLLCIFFVLKNWGADLPQGLLMCVLAIVMSGVLAGTRFAFSITVFIGLMLLSLAYLQIHGKMVPQTFWRSQSMLMPDIIIYVVTMAVIDTVSWLSNREIDKSLRRARASEKALKRERDLLEVRVEERTQELKKSQMEKLEQMARFAEFGQLASGIIHDLGNPLTAVSLNLEQAVGIDKADLSSARRYVREAISASDKMKALLQTAAKGFKTQDSSERFAICEAIKEIEKMLVYRCVTKEVKLECECPKDLMLQGNPIKFHQIVSNLLANAIDSYPNKEGGDAIRKVCLTVRNDRNVITITVQDWGTGIPAQVIEHIFDPFYTTKSADSGSGIGLFMVKGMVENNFNGTITVESEEGRGTKFDITIPASPRPGT